MRYIVKGEKYYFNEILQEPTEELKVIGNRWGKEEIC